MKTRLLTRADLQELADMATIVEAVETAFRAHAEGQAQMPPKVYISLDEHAGDFRAMPAAMAGAAGVKWVNSHPHNPAKHGLPAVMGVYVLSDPETAFPRAILDGTLLTALRTGAAGGVASRHLTASPPETIGFVGCGVQARFLLDAHRAVFGDGFHVRCADLRPEAAERFVTEIREAGLMAEVTDASAAAAADVVNTSTPGTAIAVQSDWVRDGAHVNAMGADAPGKQELAGPLLHRSQVVIDELHQASHSGEINVAWQAGELAEDGLVGTLGQVITKEVSVDLDALTLFDSTGLAVQDVAVAQELYERAVATGAGTPVDLVGQA